MCAWRSPGWVQQSAHTADPRRHLQSARRYAPSVVAGRSYVDVFTAIAAAAATLLGLLFVAVSVATDRLGLGDPVIREVRGAAAFLAFANPLIVSLFGLVPGSNVGYPALTLGIIGIFFTAAGVRSVLSSMAPWRAKSSQVQLFALLLLIFGTELACGLVVLANGERQGRALELMSYALITSIIVGIARAWEFVGKRDTGIMSSIAVILGREPRRPDDLRDGPSDTAAN
jgi:hypothetical protein